MSPMKSTDPTALYIIAGWWLIIALVVIGFFTGFFYIEEDEPEPETLEDRCEFVVKSNGGDLNISEPSAGTYKYELYATPDGYVEVWKCK